MHTINSPFEHILFNKSKYNLNISKNQSFKHVKSSLKLKKNSINNQIKKYIIKDLYKYLKTEFPAFIKNKSIKDELNSKLKLINSTDIIQAMRLNKSNRNNANNKYDFDLISKALSKKSLFQIKRYRFDKELLLIMSILFFSHYIKTIGNQNFVTIFNIIINDILTNNKVKIQRILIEDLISSNIKIGQINNKILNLEIRTPGRQNNFIILGKKTKKKTKKKLKK